MSRAGAYGFALVALLAASARGQSVISAHSGTVHFFEGAVLLDNRPIEVRPGRFASMTNGSELRTEQGSAEVILTPGVFLRVGEQTSVRMIANDLSDTRVEVLKGSAIVDTVEPPKDTAVHLIYKDWSICSFDPGTYRIDSDPGTLWVRKGNAQVATATGDPIDVNEGMKLPFAAVLVAERGDEPDDNLRRWDHGRSQSISVDNTIAANIQDPGSMDPGQASPDAFTYFPLVGVPPVYPSPTPVYSSLNPAQPGFYSTYLPPGYTYLPMSFGLVTGAFRGIYTPGRTITAPGGFGRPAGTFTTITPFPRPGVGATRPVISPPRPVVIPAHPAAARPAVGVHAAGHR
jgi:hypothetical protein